MKYLEVPICTETNAIFQSLDELDLHLEVFSCKYSKKQKKLQDYKSYTQHFANIMNENYESFQYIEDNLKMIDITNLKNELFLIFLRKRVNNFQNHINLLFFTIKTLVDLKNSQIYQFIGDQHFKRFNCQNLYFFYNKKMKRVLVLKLEYDIS
ncbi:putative Maf1 regulator protein [Pseudoloma neurophilia]|uniref:Putative Maf1 regulator protein n=1 Tax=Pseudoloma neurophilia TaxID=146866 RepID=A0A0R0LRR0_9MICR|nr:putative Maf1 regulator protein [Pseudoloma neurophilia]